MSNKSLHIIRIQLDNVAKEIPLLQRAADHFEKRVAAIMSKLPKGVDLTDERFKKPLEDLANCQKLLDEVKQNLLKYDQKQKQAELDYTTAERELAKLA